MKRNSEFIKFAIIGICCLIATHLFTSAFHSRYLNSINDICSWYTYYLSRKALAGLNLVAIAIDDYSLDKISQRWPWQRSVYAKLLDLLDKEKVKVAALDIAFVGASEDASEDKVFADAIGRASLKTVLASIFDYRQNSPLLPLQELKDASFSTAVLNTPADADDVVRRLRAYIEKDRQRYYSLSVEAAAAYLGNTPEEIANQLPLSLDHTLFINYLLRARDIKTLSFYDCLENLPLLKKRYGNDFLKDALVVVYPAAQIHHDMHRTPLGKMSGGLLHLNGIADILSGRIVKPAGLLAVVFLLFTAVALVYILSYGGFVSGLLFLLGVLVVDFWGLLLAGLRGYRFDYAPILLLAVLFFAFGNLYKYSSFFFQLLKIKDKATIDPLRGLYTLRYFYYRLWLQAKKIYFFKDSFFIFISLGRIKEALSDMGLDKARQFWKELSAVLYAGEGFWSVYSAEEVVGCIVASPRQIDRKAEALANRLEAILAKHEVGPALKIVYLRLKKKYAIAELLYFLSSEAKELKGKLRHFREEALSRFEADDYAVREAGREPLTGIGSDIEEKNRQLLSLIDNLNKEHAKTKEAFFQIITSLVNALEARDPYTEGHSERVGRYALMLAEKLRWPAEEKEKLKKAALLHDLGKIGIPDSILHKKGPLTDEEFDFIRKHEIIGVKILQPLTELAEILPWILYHHERWDGKGYPHGLAGEAIPEAAQILSLADVFDALTTGRDYKPAFSYEEAVKELSKNKALQFNPRLTDAFLEVISPLRSTFSPGPP